MGRKVFGPFDDDRPLPYSDAKTFHSYYGDYDIYLYNGISTTTLSDPSRYDVSPDINSQGDIVWASHDYVTEPFKIFLARYSEDSDGDGVLDDQDACPDEDATGFDSDGDGCIDSINGLSSMIQTLLDQGVIDEQMENSLISKIESAQGSADRDNICTAINQIDALINQVDAQKGKKISDEAADDIIAYSNSLITWLTGNLPEGDSC